LNSPGIKQTTPAELNRRKAVSGVDETVWQVQGGMT
jgi:hypothetical protein